MFLHELNDEQKEAFICLAHDVVVSDGELTPGEQTMMEQLRREIGLSADFEPHYIPLAGIDKIFSSRRSRIAIIIALIRLGYADDRFEIEEQFILKEVCEIFGVAEEEFARIENWVRRLISLEKEAQDFM